MKLSRTRLSKMLGALVAVAAIGVLPSHAQGASVCTFESQIEVSPGVSLTPHEGTFRTTSGTITCHGSIEASGTIAYSGVTGQLGGENCAFDLQGNGTLEYVIGALDETGSFTFTRGAVAGSFNGTTQSGPIVGTFQFSPATGEDCATVPVQHATVTGQAVLPY